MAGLIEKDRYCQHCGKRPITGYKYCPNCKNTARLIKVRERGGHKERKEQLRAQKEAIKQQIEGIGVKVCTQCNKEKAMTEFSTQGDWRSRKNTCKECLSKGETYKPKTAQMRLEGDRKECGKCHTMKALNEYYVREGGKGGRRLYCIRCERGKLYYKKRVDNKERKIIKVAISKTVSEKENELAMQKIKDERKIIQSKMEAEKVKNMRRAERYRRDRRLKGLNDTTITANAIRIIRLSKECPYCGNELIKGSVHLDHMQPIALKGEHSKYNLIACCADCNLKKAAMSFDQWADSLGIFRSGLVKEIYQAKQVMRETHAPAGV